MKKSEKCFHRFIRLNKAVAAAIKSPSGRKRPAVMPGLEQKQKAGTATAYQAKRNRHQSKER